jgi:hypothetical protein
LFLEEESMKRFCLVTLLLCVGAIGAQAQTPTPPATSPGPVWRITYYSTKPGKGADYTKFRREHTKLILDEVKKQGLILDYKWFTKPTSDGPTDWDVALAIMFRNYAEALDFNAENAQKLNDITLKHYGTAEARTKAGDSQRELRDVVSSHLVREEILNPIK